MRLLQELKQRNVFRIAVLYIVIAWLILQVADVVFGIFQLPPWALSLTATLLAIGFLPAIIFAWVFEVTPEGIKLEKDVDRSAAAGESSGKRMTVVTVGLLIVAIGLFISEPLWRGDTAKATNKAIEIADSTNASDAPARNLGIAVLPFRNLSADEDNVFFAGGVHEEVLSNLSRISGLRVISSTSMLRIAETDLDVRGIGARLGVSHVMQGSVRRAANSVRVSVQLIDAATDEQLWSANYDDTLDDIFKIQTDIAQQIANSLRATLSPEAVASMQARPTKSQAAYDLYLRANRELSFWQGADTFMTMRAQLEEALRLDPNFIEARVLLMTAYGRLYWLRWETKDDHFAALAAEQLALIEAQAPTSMAAKKAKAFYTYLVDYDYQATLELLEPLNAELPNNIEIVRYMSSSLKRLGESERFLDAARRWQSLDPESAVAFNELNFAYRANRLLPEAEAASRNAVQRYPEDVSSLVNLLDTLMLRGKDAEALDVINRIVALDPTAKYRPDRLWLTYSVDGLDAARAAYQQPSLDSLNSIDATTDMALILRHAGDHEKEAQQYADRAFKMYLQVSERDLPNIIEDAKTTVYATLALSAATIGNRQRFQEYHEQVDALLDKSSRQQSNNEIVYEYYHLALGQAILGDPESGWVMLEPFLANGLFDQAFAVPRAKQDLAFGSVAGYQNYIREHTPAWTATGD